MGFNQSFMVPAGQNSGTSADSASDDALCIVKRGQYKLLKVRFWPKAAVHIYEFGFI
jgi:hypothetical protein